jgi:hypothetical protein
VTGLLAAVCGGVAAVGTVALGLWGVASETAARARWECYGPACCQWQAAADMADALHAEVADRYERLIGLWTPASSTTSPPS